MKRSISLLLSLLLAAGLSVTALAQGGSVTISTTVPATHQVTVEAQPGGQILPQDLPPGETLDVGRQQEQVYRIVPARGQRLAKLLYNGEDVTDQVVNGLFTAPPLQGDATLEAFFERDPFYHWYDDSDDDEDEDDEDEGFAASVGKNDRGDKGGSSHSAGNQGNKGLPPETGDRSHPALWLGLLMLGSAGYAATLALEKKQGPES